MRYLFLALIPLLFSGCVVRLPHHAHPALYYDAGHPHGHGHKGHGGHHRKLYRR